MGKKLLFCKRAVSIILVVVCLSYLLPTVSYAQGEEPSNETLKEVQHFVTEQLKDNDVIGGAYGIVYKGKLIDANGYGVTDSKTKEKVTPTTIYPLASVTKSLTAFAILRLYNERAIDLGDKVTSYLPWFRYANKEKSSLVTIENLLTHSAGVNRLQADGAIYLDEQTNRNSLEASIRSLSSVEMTGNPGQKGEYCNTCYNTLGLIIEKATNQQYQTFMKNSVFEPIGMNQTTFAPEQAKGNVASEYNWLFGFKKKSERNNHVFGKSQNPEGGAYSSVEDISKFIAVLQGHGTSPSLLSPELLSKAQTEGVIFDKENQKSYTLSGFEEEKIQGHRVLYKGGDGIGSASGILLLPEEELAIVLLIGESQPELKKPMLHGIAFILTGEKVELIDSPVNPWKVIGLISLILLFISLLVLILLGISLRKNLKNKFQLKRSWTYVMGCIFFPFVSGTITYLLFTMRPAQVGFYGYPWDLATALITVAIVFFLYTLFLILSLCLHFKRKSRLLGRWNVS